MGLPRTPALALLGALAGAAGLAGCSAQGTGSGVTASGTTLTIYLSAPADPSLSTQDVLAAEQLAFAQSGGQVGKFKLKLVPLTSGELSAHARTAIQDSTAIAYLGELVPGSSADSIGITNAEDLLQVSPTDTAVELTRSTSAVPGSPDRYYESLGSYGRTFARVVPSTAQEARAQVQEIRHLGVSRLYVSSDGSPYGAAIAAEVRRAARAVGVTVVSSAAAADGEFLGALPSEGARQLLAAAGASLKLFAPSALADAAFISGLGDAGRRLYVSEPGFLRSGLSAAGRTFVSQFRTRYGHVPEAQAIFGYEAMKAVIDVLREAGSAANSRSTVAKDFLAIHDRSSVLGSYSIDSGGDTSLAPFVFSREKRGGLVPFAAVTATR